MGGPGAATGSVDLTGKIDRVEDTFITITARMGSQKIYFGSETQVNKTASGSASDIKKGQQVWVTGTRKSDGTITAKSLTIGGS